MLFRSYTNLWRTIGTVADWVGHDLRGAHSRRCNRSRSQAQPPVGDARLPGIADKPEVSLDRLCKFALEAQIYRECLRYYLYAAIANEGVRLVPRVVDSIERDGETIYCYEKGSLAMQRRRFAEVGGDHHPAHLQTRVEVGDQLAFAYVHAVGRHPFISAPAVIPDPRRLQPRGLEDVGDGVADGSSR